MKGAIVQRTSIMRPTTAHSAKKSHSHTAPQYEVTRAPQTNWICLEPLARSRTSDAMGAAAVYAKGTRMTIAASRPRVARVAMSRKASVSLGSGSAAATVRMAPRPLEARRMRASYTLASSVGSAWIDVELKASVVM